MWLPICDQGTLTEALVGLAEVVKTALLSTRYGPCCRSGRTEQFYCTSAVPFYSPGHELNLAIEVVSQ